MENSQTIVNTTVEHKLLPCGMNWIKTSGDLRGGKFTHDRELAESINIVTCQNVTKYYFGEVHYE